MNKILKVIIGSATTVVGGWTLVNAFMGKGPAIPTPTQVMGGVAETFETVQDAVESISETVTE